MTDSTYSAYKIEALCVFEPHMIPKKTMLKVLSVFRVHFVKELYEGQEKEYDVVFIDVNCLQMLMKSGLNCFNKPIILLRNATEKDTTENLPSFVEASLMLNAAVLEALCISIELMANIKGLEPLHAASTHYGVTEEEEFLDITNQIITTFILEEDLTICFIAKRLAISTYKFRTKIKCITGITAVKYLLNQRLELAKIKIEKEHLFVNEAALETGFSSMSYFSKTFKNYFGYYPSDIKKTSY